MPVEPQRNILIVGGTGMLGRELAHQLLQSGNEIYVMTRSAEKCSDLRQAGVHIISGDLIDKASLLKACKGMDIVVAAAHSLIGKGKYDSPRVDYQGHKDLIDAAKQNGVKYFIYTSVIGVRTDSPIDLWKTKANIENYLKQTGMAYTIIRASAFMELHVGELIGKPILAKGKVTLFGLGDNPTNFVSVRDVASVMKYCLDHHGMHDRTIEIGGLDNVTRKEIVEMYSSFTGKEIKVAHVPRGALKVMSFLIKPFHPGLSRIMFLSQYLDARDESFDVRPLLESIPLRITRMEDFIRSG